MTDKRSAKRTRETKDDKASAKSAKTDADKTTDKSESASSTLAVPIPVTKPTGTTSPPPPTGPSSSAHTDTAVSSSTASVGHKAEPVGAPVTKPKAPSKLDLSESAMRHPEPKSISITDPSGATPTHAKTAEVPSAATIENKANDLMESLARFVAGRSASGRSGSDREQRQMNEKLMALLLPTIEEFAKIHNCILDEKWNESTERTEKLRARMSALKTMKSRIGEPIATVLKNSQARVTRTSDTAPKAVSSHTAPVPRASVKSSNDANTEPEAELNSEPYFPPYVPPVLPNIKDDKEYNQVYQRMDMKDQFLDKASGDVVMFATVDDVAPPNVLSEPHADFVI